MSVRVVSESHQFNDDYTWVPSDSEFEDLEGEVNRLSRKTAALRTTIESFEREMATQDKKIAAVTKRTEDIATRNDALKDDIASELMNGQWRNSLEDFVKAATTCYRKCVQEIGQSTTKQISDLVRHEMEAKNLNDVLTRLSNESLRRVEMAADSAVNKIELSVKEVSEDVLLRALDVPSFEDHVKTCIAECEKMKQEVFEFSVCKQHIQVAEGEVEKLLNDVASVRSEFENKLEQSQISLSQSQDLLSKVRKLNRRLKLQTAIAMIVAVVTVLYVVVLR